MPSTSLKGGRISMQNMIYIKVNCYSFSFIHFLFMCVYGDKEEIAVTDVEQDIHGNE